MANRSICFDKRRQLTIIAALYLWQRGREQDLIGEEMDVATNDGSLKEMTSQELSELIFEISELESEVEESNEL